MNEIEQDKVSVGYDGGDKIKVNGKIYDVPEQAQGNNSLRVIDGKVFVNGFEFDTKTGEWGVSKSHVIFHIAVVIVSLLLFFMVISGLFY